MSEKLKINDLRFILSDQIDWYEKNKHDEDLLYDEMIEKFSDLSRGDYLRIIEILAH